jgi:tetratricopeptide (TPR) repeat protein
VKKINSILEEMQAKQLAYNNAIKQADNAFNAQQYQQAITFYKKATSILPDKQYPKDRVLEAEKLLAEAGKRKKYQEQITLGDNNFNNKNYTAALTNYQAALQIYPEEQYPKNRIDEINTILKNLENKQQAYDEAIAEADEAFNNEIYDKAKIQYNNALGIFPEKQYPKDQIKRINQELAELQKINEAYNAAIASADEAFDNTNYEKAKQYYTKASNLKPNEQYPKDRLAQITKYQEEAKQKQEAYDKAIAEGDKAYDDAAYEKAKTAYENALAIFPNETYPQTRLKEINQIISSRQGKEQAYRKAVQQGDKYLRSNAYNKAIDSYEYALKIDPTKKYPKDKIREVKKIIEDEKALAKFYAQGYLDVAGKTTIPKNKSEKFKFMAFDQHKIGSYATIKIKNLSTRDLNIFLNYGKGAVKNGGFTFKIAASDNAKEYKIDLSKHSQWIIQRNNWISLYPAGGSIEIQDIKIHFGK